MSANNLTPYRIPKKNGAASAEVSNPKSDSDDAPLANIRKKKTPAKSSPDGQYGAGAEASAPKSKNKIKSAKKTKNSKASTESTPPVSRLKYIMDIISTPSPARTAHMPKTIDDGADRAITSCNATDSKVTNPSPGVTVTAQEVSLLVLLHYPLKVTPSHYLDSRCGILLPQIQTCDSQSLQSSQ